MGFIFYMSSRSIDVSRGDSARVMSVLGLVANEDDALHIENPAMFRLHNAVRKYAHFVIYMGLGMLYFASIYGYFGGILPTGGLALLMTALYGATDEIHQIFTNRGASVSDVLYDTAGGLAGVALMAAVFFAVLKIKRLKMFFSRFYDFEPRRILWKRLASRK